MANFPRVVDNKGISEGLSVVLNNKLYVFGGYNPGNYRPIRDLYVFDPKVGSRGTWTRLADMPKGNTHAGIATDGQRYIYIVSGYIQDVNDKDNDGNTTEQLFGTTDVYRYDTQENSYIPFTPLPGEQAAGTAAIIGNQLHYVGGTNTARNAELGNHWVLDLSNPNATWQARAPLPNPRHHKGGVAYGGKFYVVGGQRKHDGSLEPQADVHVYDPATDTWSKLANLPEARNHISSTTFVLNGEIYVLAGQYNNEDPRDTVFAYNIATNTWRTVAQIGTLWSARHSAVGGAIDGKLYIATGSFKTSSYEGTLQPIP
jgi:N-acetylneuraminic acid mutarotase